MKRIEKKKRAFFILLLFFLTANSLKKIRIIGFILSVVLAVLNGDPKLLLLRESFV
jgi:hypothetical protein